MPHNGIISKIPANEIAAKEISIETAIRLGQLYGVSHLTFILRLKELKIINSENANKLCNIKIAKEAALRGLLP
jgi:plasmid maintenance system antidote protein VapI